MGPHWLSRNKQRNPCVNYTDYYANIYVMGSRGQIANEQAVIGINIRLSDSSVLTTVPTRQSNACNINTAIFEELGKCGAYINIALRRTRTCRCDASNGFENFYLAENIV